MPGQAVIAVNSKQWAVGVANTLTEITSGLSGVSSIPSQTGMLFDLGSDQSSIQIDMSRMLFPLDIIFINSTQGVRGVMHNVNPGEAAVFEATTTPGARCFLEVNAGEAEGIEVGDSVAVQGLAPQNAGLDLSGLMNFMLIFVVMFMMMRMVDRALEAPEKPKMLGYGEAPPGYKPVHHSSEIGHPSSEEEATFPPEARKDLTFCKHMWELEKTIGRPFTREEVSERWERWKELRYRPKTEEERKLVHSLKYGTEELPERGKGTEGGFEVEWQDWGGTWRHWATLWNREAAEAEAMEARKRLPDMEVRVRPVGGSSSNPTKEYKVHFIGACKIVDGLCHTHGYSVSKAVKCPESPLTDEEWAAAWELAEVAYPEGMSNPWVNGWWPETEEEAEKAAWEYERKMRDAIYMFRAKQMKAIENYERGADKAIYNYRRYVIAEYERGRELSAVATAEHHSEITAEEWRFAEGMWEVTRDGFTKGDTASTYLWALVTRHYPENKDKQIRAMGFMNEVAEKYRGRISREEAWKLARKWDVEKMLTTELMEFFPGQSEHHSMWLTPEQRKELEEKYGAVAVRWAEEATKPSDIKGAEAAAEYYYGKLKEVFGLGHLSPQLSEEQIRKLREVLGLPPDVAKVLKIHQETGYVP